MPAAKICNRTIFVRDNLEVLRQMADNSAALIYLDPPFNKKKTFSAPAKNRAPRAAFKDTWTLADTDNAWWGEIAENHPALYAVIHAAGEVGGAGDKAYLIYMAARLLEMRRVLRDDGTLYYHCDPTMSHAVKLTLDAVFGKKNFRNELVWHYETGGVPRGDFARKHDIILRYGKTARCKFFPDEVREPRSDEVLRRIATGSPNATRATGLTRHPTDVWKIPAINAQARERLNYPTQKPLALLERLIKSSTEKGDLVLDPFCGGATACAAAESLARKWIGIDISPRAAELTKQRLAARADIKTKITIRRELPKTKPAAKRRRNVLHILYGQQQGVCNGCKNHFAFVNFKLDSAVRAAKESAGGDNSQLLCGLCHRLKNGAREK